ncbi:unnamed protein product [Cuscuta epithymum]|uniref:Floricaula/leafy-like transcription factor n=1 Tax=Cuscuta epithymum TaxID=186058 RepID=A0AAV0D7K4_9ASTE|nr:unnamed protein product [Cuscuta epithymum]
MLTCRILWKKAMAGGRWLDGGRTADGGTASWVDIGRHSVDMGNLQRKRRKEIATSHPSLRKGKGKGRAGSSSQSQEDFDDGYQRRDVDAMSDEQLQQLLAQNDGRFFQQQNIP